MTPRAEVLQEAAGTQYAMKYIGRRNRKVSQWVDLRYIFELCAREIGYKGGRCRRDVWCCQEAVDTWLR